MPCPALNSKFSASSDKASHPLHLSSCALFLLSPQALQQGAVVLHQSSIVLPHGRHLTRPLLQLGVQLAQVLLPAPQSSVSP